MLIERLKSIYHTRIQYPKLSKEAQKTALHEKAKQQEAELKAEEKELKRVVSEEEKKITEENTQDNNNKEMEEKKTEN